MQTLISIKRTKPPEAKRAHSPLNEIGFRASWASLVFAWGYSAAQLLSWLKIIAWPHDLFWLFFPSLFLAPAFLMVMICLHYKAPQELRIWTAIGSAFAIIYCTLATLTYFTQLGSVVPGILRGDITESHVLFFKPRSFAISIDCLGYFFMSLSTLFTGMAFRQLDKGIYRWFVLNGLLVILFIAAYFNPFLYFVGSVWVVTFSLSMLRSARFFK